MNKDLVMYIFGGMISLAFFTLLCIILFVEIPTPNKDIINITIGALIGAFAQVVNYFYGSSKGSKDKTKLLNNK